MKKRRNLVKLGCLLAFFCFCVIPNVGRTVVVCAESGINEEEEKLVKLAHKTFTYKGKKYKAHQQYIDASIAYIAQDGIDLTKNQVKSIISEFYANLWEGISRGYLYEVTGEEDVENTKKPSVTKNPTNTANPSNTANPANPSSPSVDSEDMEGDDWFEQEKYLEDDFEIPEKTLVPKATLNPTEIDHGGTLIEGPKKEQEEIINNRLPKEEADVVVGIDSKTGKLVDDEGKQISLVLGYRSYVSVRLQDTIVITSILIGGITLLSIAILYGTKCFVFQKRRKREGKKRGRIRNSIRKLFVVTVSIETFFIILLVAAQITLSNNVLLTTIADSSYYRSSYEEYQINASDVLGELTYEQYLLDMKNRTNQLLDGTQVDNHVVSYVLELKTEVRDLFTVVLPSMLVSLVLSIPTLLFMDSSKRKGLRILAYGVGIGTAIVLLATTGVAILKPYASVYISPDYLYLLFVHYVWKGCGILFTVCGIGAVLELVIVLLLHRKINRKL